ncbi:helix-turn-helix domain-containing protein, partial [Ferrimicrobium acidiphilum]|uniref:helix-turn-helix domain-containing protein n=1 Tax=Ferrimicrobium acidiphilum TaxID=121039 RepID=UPI0023F46877
RGMPGGLRETRTAAGLTQMQLAERLLAAIRAAGEDWGPTRAENLQGQIARWETGRSAPSARWWPYLRALLPDLADSDNTVVDSKMTRRDFLTGALAITALSASAATARSLGLVASSALAPTRTLGSSELADFQDRVRSAAKRYASGIPQWIEAEAVNLLAEGMSYLPNAGARRADVAVAAAWAGLLAGRLAFFDRGDPTTGDAHLATAAAFAQTGGDAPLLAAVFAHRAFVAGFGGDYRGAAAWLRRSDVTAPRRGQPLLRSWLHCTRAELAARVGERDTAAKEIRSAADGMSRTGDVPEWFDWYDESRFESFAGSVALSVGKHTQAIDRLAVAREGITSVKQQAVVAFDLALAYSNDAPELAIEHATEALTLVRERQYLTALDRLPALESALAGTSWAKELRRRERELLAVG